MGGCVSTPGPALSEAEKQRHRAAERQLKEAKQAMDSQVKVLLLGSGDSGKSTILKQMRLIHRVPFTSHEIEFYRALVFSNLTYGMKCVLDAMDELDLAHAPEHDDDVKLVEDAPDIKDGQAYPAHYQAALARLWEDPAIQTTIARGNEFALPENLQYFFPQLARVFEEGYKPTNEDIVNTRARTIGITETAFKLKDHEMIMVDVGGQKSERRKWIHCFQDVTSILFLVSLSGYDQCLVEDKDANQMQDAMTIWDAICHSQWFKQTSIILFLNKDDLFRQKVQTSDIKNFFPDFDGQPKDADAGRDYFKKRFARLAQKAGRSKEREVYIHTTTATDTTMLRKVMSAVEDIVMRSHLEDAALI